MRYILVLILICSAGPSFAGDPVLGAWGEFSESGKAGMMISWLKTQALHELSGPKSGAPRKGLGLSANETPLFYGHVGIFITLVKGKKIRGCYGAFHHRSGSLEDVMREYLRGALRYDERYRPLAIEELDGTDIIVTITSMPYPVQGVEDLDISRHGVMVAYEDGGNAVYVPAEMKTRSHLLSSIGNIRAANIFAFSAVTIK